MICVKVVSIDVLITLRTDNTKVNEQCWAFCVGGVAGENKHVLDVNVVVGALVESKADRYTYRFITGTVLPIESITESMGH